MTTLEGVEAFLKSRQAKGLSPRTINWYRVTLHPFAAMFPVLPDKPEAIEDFLIQCRAGDERRHGYYRALRAFYRFLARRFKVDNIVAMVDAPKRQGKRPHPLTLDELDQLLSFPHPVRIHTALTFLADSGARVGEASRLKTEDLTETQWGPVARVTGKTGARIIPISEGTYQLLLRILPFRLSANRLCRLVSAAFRDAHVKGTAHSLRHTFGTYWEGDEMILQYILGHANISTTQIYRQLRTKKMCEQHHEHSPLKMVAANRQLPFSLDIS
jgi:integrase/recombinase XerD